MKDNFSPNEWMSAEEFEARFLQGSAEALKSREVTNEAIHQVLEKQDRQGQQKPKRGIPSLPERKRPRTPEESAEYDKQTRRLYEKGFAMITNGLDFDALGANQASTGLWNRLKGAVSGSSLNLFEEAVSLRSKKMVGWLELKLDEKSDIMSGSQCEEGDFLAFMAVRAEDRDGKTPLFYSETRLTSDSSDDRLLIFDRGDLTPEWAGFLMIGGLAHLYYNLKGLSPDKPKREDIAQRMMVEHDAMLLAADHYSGGEFLKAFVEILGSLNLKTQIEVSRFTEDKESPDFIRVRDEIGGFFGPIDNLSGAELYSRGMLVAFGLLRAKAIRDTMGPENDFDLFELGKKVAFSPTQKFFNGGRLTRTALKGVSSIGTQLFRNRFLPSGDEEK